MTRIPRQTTDARSGAGCFELVPLGTPPKRILTPGVERSCWLAGLLFQTGCRSHLR
jgi:hypothetical protein